MIDYNSLNGKLISAGTGVWASESHGFLCGVFCAGNTVASSIWQEYLLAGVEEPLDHDESFALLTLDLQQFLVYFLNFQQDETF